MVVVESKLLVWCGYGVVWHIVVSSKRDLSQRFDGRSAGLVQVKSMCCWHAEGGLSCHCGVRPSNDYLFADAWVVL